MSIGETAARKSIDWRRMSREALLRLLSWVLLIDMSEADRLRLALAAASGGRLFTPVNMLSVEWEETGSGRRNSKNRASR